VRELKNAIERAVVVTEGEVVTLASLPPILQASAAGLRGADAEQVVVSSSASLDDRMAQLERAFVIEALGRAGGVQAAAARLLGVTERSVWHLVKKHRIDVEKIKERATPEDAQGRTA
jgi:DNA-binding NtrC family response regulator